MIGTRSAQLLSRAHKVMPGGVSSPVRAFGGVGGEPFVVARGEGARIWDVDDNEYIDFVLSWGPLVLGHAAPVVLDALEATMRRGTSFGITTELEIELAELITQRLPHVEMIRFVSSGTEATMSALRLARAATGRDAFLKFDGCYHGHADSFLVRAGSGVATLGLPNSPGVPDAIASLTRVAPFNDVEAVRKLAHEEPLAAIFVEPLVGNSGFIPPDPGFLQSLRDIATETGALLVFDEVMTGFRIAPGGARERYGVTADLTTLGKVIGGGLPLAAYGGRRDLMEQIAPAGPVYQAGTLSGSPPAMAAGCAALDVLHDNPSLYGDLERLGDRLAAGFRAAAADAGVACAIGRVGSMITPFLGIEEARSFDEVKCADRERFGTLHARWLDAGILWPPSQFETAFLSVAHSDADVDRTVEVFTATLDQLLYLQGFMPVLQCVMTAKYKMPGLSLNTGAGVVTPESIGGLVELIDKGIR